MWEALHVSLLFEEAHEFDLIHNSFDFLPLVFSRLVEPTIVTTIHGFASDATLPVYVEHSDRVSYVAISEADRHPALRYAATIHHGIDMRAFELGTGGSPLLFLGRIDPDKGTTVPIEVAKQAGVPLIIAVIQDAEYYEREVEPHLDGRDVTYVGPVGPSTRQRLLGGAHALLHLIDFEEPFGLSVVEAMACGTPVIAHALGSMREIVQPGINGHLVDGVADSLGAVGDVGKLDRAMVRASMVDRFDVNRMVDDYLALYIRLLAESHDSELSSG